MHVVCMYNVDKHNVCVHVCCVDLAPKIIFIIIKRQDHQCMS